MHITRLGGVLASLAIAAGTTAALAAPAHAANTEAVATLDVAGQDRVAATYGDSVGLLGGGVTYAQTDGTTAEVNAGAAQLQRKVPGGVWKVVRTDETAGSFDFGTYGSRALGNVAYRVHYLGGTGTDSVGNPMTWDPAYSNVVLVGTFWALHDSGHCTPRCHLQGWLAPTARHHRVVIQVKHGVWKRYKVVYTNRRSHYQAYITPTRGTGTRYRILVGATPRLLKTFSGVYIAIRYS